MLVIAEEFQLCLGYAPFLDKIMVEDIANHPLLTAAKCHFCQI